ncbi:fused MFS/spermidine synthase [Gemmata sp.]|uniref:fused MFS/spermidine synthase n=1 Tax=Gemmata sp. TaxID=1914242 RepID=UPI003F718E56
MSSAAISPGTAALPLGRLAAVGAIVFAANAALLVLQLVASRLLSPFIGSSLETWTSVIGVFLVGIALGNALGGRLADRFPTPRTLATLLLVGALAALWMVVFPAVLASTEAHKAIPLGPRIPLLALVLCLPAGFVLSLLTPLSIKLGLQDVSKAGRVAGLIFALSTLGCLLGNYLTGFYLMRTFTINELVYIAAGCLAVLGVATQVMVRTGEPGASATGGSETTSVADAPGSPIAGAPGSPQTNPYAFSDIRFAYLVVFLASFCGMTLELTAARVLAQFLGVSLFTWTGIIGVMLAGTALGNLAGGWLADRVNRPGSPDTPRWTLATVFILGGAFTAILIITIQIIEQRGMFVDLGPIAQVLAWSFTLFFAPMFLLGTVSPQVIRLAVPDVAHVGRVAGRVYAWSTTGAIVGTFAAGYVLLSTLGMYKTLLAVSCVLVMTSLLAARVWDNNTLLYLFSIVLGGVVGGFILNVRAGGRSDDLVNMTETNYYTIQVSWVRVESRDREGRPLKDPQGRQLYERSGRLQLLLDHLVHSTVDPENPDYLHYPHEYVQLEVLRGARALYPNPRVLVIGGGGYTFPRCAMEALPETRMDVVEIDPGVTKVARNHLGLRDYDGMTVTHMDGRQFVSERVAPGTYDLVIQDAVNDLSVPSHLLTKEYNDAVKRALKPNGVYLLTVIDVIEYGKLWKAAVHTLQQTYPPGNVSLLMPGEPNAADISGRRVWVIYASNAPVDVEFLRFATRHQMIRLEPLAQLAATLGGGSGFAVLGGAEHALAALAAAPRVADHAVPFRTVHVPHAIIKPYLDAERPVILTDQFAPTDNLMADVFRHRREKATE